MSNPASLATSFGIAVAITLTAGFAVGQTPPCGAALRLSGQNFVSVPTAAELQNADQATFECWFRGRAPRARILSKGDGGSCNSNRTFDFSYEPNKTVSCWFFLSTPSTANRRWCVAMPGPKVELNTWAHVAATFDASKREAKFFVNGKLVTNKSFPAGSKLFQSTTPLYIGATPPYQYLNGDIKQVRVWKVALSPALIKGLMSVPLTRFPNLVGSWPLSGHLFDTTGKHEGRPAGRGQIGYVAGCGTWTRYGRGTQGPFGIPSWGVDTTPVLGRTITFQADNQSNAGATAASIIGLVPQQTPLVNGTLLVRPDVVLPIPLAASGLKWPVAVPNDSQMLGTPFFTQLLVLYPRQSSLGFSQGLQLMVGNR